MEYRQLVLDGVDICCVVTLNAYAVIVFLLSSAVFQLGVLARVWSESGAL